METLPELPVAASELKERFAKACELKQTLNWDKIVSCFQQWAMAMEINVPPVVRIERLEQYKRAGDSPEMRWHINLRVTRVIHAARTGKDGKYREGIKWSDPSLCAVRAAVLASPVTAAEAGIRTRFDVNRTVEFSLAWLSFVAVRAVELGYAYAFSIWYPLFEAFEAGAYCFFFTEQGIEVCTVPSVLKTDDRNRLHSESGPAFVLLDDVSDYYWHGVRVEPHVVENPERITVADIEADPHAEARQVKIERMGQVYANGEMPKISSVTAGELKDRYIRACELKQTVNWERIAGYFQRWAAAYGIDATSILRVESFDQLKRAEMAAWAAAGRRASSHSFASAVRRAQLQTNNPATLDWDIQLLEIKARGLRNLLSRANADTKVDEKAKRVEELERLEADAISKREKSAVSPASAAIAVRTAKVGPAVGAALNLWVGEIELNGTKLLNGMTGEIGWDVTLKSITAIDALEQADPGTKFSNGYQLFKAFEAGAFCFFITERCIEVCTIPTIVKMDEQGRLHSTSGPALAWLSDIRLYYWHGVRVEPYVVENPERITVADIEQEQNTEVRRVKIEQFGMARYLIAAGAREIHRDDYGILYRKQIPDDESLAMVKVMNATAEPDGSFKEYFLRVPPYMRTAREAVAWTFGKTAANYKPDKET